MGFSATAMQDQLRGVPHEYIAPPHGVVLTDHKYMVNNTIDCGIERTSNDSYWRTYGPIVCNDTFAYANGGATYILSTKAVRMLGALRAPLAAHAGAVGACRVPGCLGCPR